MMSPALLALTAPAQMPAAALARLGVTAATLLGESLSARAGLYAGLLGRLATLADRSRTLVTAALAGTASAADLAGMANAERVAHAGAVLLEEVARRAERRARIYAMQWAQDTRRLWADLALIRQEFAPSAYLGVDWSAAQTVATIRILPGAEGALTTLTQDPLRSAAAWDLPALATTLSRWVQA